MLHFMIQLLIHHNSVGDITLVFSSLLARKADPNMFSIELEANLLQDDFRQSLAL